ncbi:MAG TPA: class I SAM-dependent methyltransferase family protein [Chloroflexia bacterium]
MQLNSSLKWRALSFFMSNPGRASDGIALGYRYGFDSGEMLDYVYENRARGKFLLGALVDRVYLNTIGWRAIRTRKELLKATLHRQVRDAGIRNEPLVVLDVAAGPGRYLLEVCQELRAAGRGKAVQVVCRDLDNQGLALGRARAHRLGLENVRYEWGDATDAESLGSVQPRPDIVVVSGLYELFTDAAIIKRSMEAIYGILKPGGTLIFTTQVTHPQLELIANVLVNREGKPWRMVCRSVEEAEGLAREAGFEGMRSELERLGLFGVTVCRKSAGLRL